MVMNSKGKVLLIVFMVIIGLIITCVIMRITWNRNQWKRCRMAFARCCCKCCYRDDEDKEEDADDKYKRAESFY